MRFGIAYFPTADTVQPDELGRMAEERGLESLLVAEHSHIPASRETPFPGGGELPLRYHQTYDPFVALTAAAAATERLLVGTGVCLVVQRDPIHTAKEVATLDRLSGGRFLFGVGAGWNEEEMRDHGTDPRTRFSLMRERIEAMKAIWTQEEPEYHGRHVDFGPMWQEPKPVQEPHPPILVGGLGSKVLDRVIAFGDEWLPNRIGDEDRFLERVERLRRRAREEAGREVRVSLARAPSDPAQLERVEAAGIHRVLTWLPQAERGEVERALDRWAELATSHAGGDDRS